jgi:alpha-tubulin suppressor-like RCC1 family protein
VRRALQWMAGVMVIVQGVYGAAGRPMGERVLQEGVNGRQASSVRLAVSVTKVAAGMSHSIALGIYGTLWAWGANSNYQLGKTGTNNQPTPALVSTITEVQVVAAGGFHNLALRGDGTVWAWGRGFEGQLGRGTLDPVYRAKPLQVLGLSGVTAVAAGTWHSLAVRNDGTVWS